ncbi:MAG: hypothetical protein Q9186_001836 [Xanthomendoza sp. 1 TL-2023]
MSETSTTRSTLGKRSRNDQLDDGHESPTNPSKRPMTTPPATPRSPRNRRSKCDVDRLSPRHQIFKNHSPHMSPSGSAMRWINELDAFFNPSLSSMASQTTKSSPSRQRPWTTPGSQSTGSSNEPFQVQPNNSRPKRQRYSQVDTRQLMSNPTYLPQIGEDDYDYGFLRPVKIQESSAPSTRSKKRGAAELLAESAPAASEDTDNTRPQPAKRQRTTSSGSSQAKLITSSSKFPPTIKQLEMMERDSSLKNRRLKIIKPALPDAYVGKGYVAPEGSWLDTWFSMLPSSRVQRKIEDTTEKMRKLKVGGRMNGDSDGNRWVL